MNFLIEMWLISSWRINDEGVFTLLYCKKDRSYWTLNIISGLNNVFVAHFSLGKSDPQEICLTVICIPDF